MEAIGVAASLVQLMECALSIAKTSKKLYKSYKGASEGFKSVSSQSALLQTVIHELSLLRPRFESNECQGESKRPPVLKHTGGASQHVLLPLILRRNIDMLKSFSICRVSLVVTKSSCYTDELLVIKFI